MNRGLQKLVDTTNFVLRNSSKASAETKEIHKLWSTRRWTIVNEEIKRLSSSHPEIADFVSQYATLTADGLLDIYNSDNGDWQDLAVDVIKDHWETLLVQSRAISAILKEKNVSNQTQE